MSTNFIEFNKQSVAQKQYGSGDCVPALANSKNHTRTPVASSRRFNPYAKRDENLPQKIEAALKELRTPTAKTPTPSVIVNTEEKKRAKSARRNIVEGLQRKRSLTMSEITPKKKKGDRSRLRADDGASPRITAPTTSTVLQSGRRVFQLLLLNAWRRRREQVASLTESSAQRETLMNQLKVQLDAVHKLRKHECMRREEAVGSMNETAQLLEQCRQELALFRQSSDENITKLEDLLDREQQQNVKLRQEKDCQESTLLAKIQNANLRLANCHEEISDLKKLAKHFQDESEKNSKALRETVAERDELITRISQLEETSEDYETKLCNVSTESSMTNQVLKVLQRKLEESQKKQTLLEESNYEKAKVIEELQEALEKLEKRSWWKKAGDLILTPMELVKFAVHSMLPSLL